MLEKNNEVVKMSQFYSETSLGFDSQIRHVWASENLQHLHNVAASDVLVFLLGAVILL